MAARARFVLYIVFTTLVSYSIFLLGFFPVKSSVQQKALLRNHTLNQYTISQSTRRFNRTVIVLIDALRYDFVGEHDYMPFTRKHIAGGSGYIFTLRAHPPTVTLPRIKALTSGSIPGFVDVVLNFDSKSLQDDNIISQAHTHGRRIVFYGDDTWIKLFPNDFLRSEGTTSFFVTDYTEVDDNVTRHIDTELSALDWDLMILHYLGLDHIGHTAGPRSPLVPPKLLEMDNIIKNIYTSLEKQEGEFVILVCGDHGMSDQGSHGGASDSEVFVPAVFLSPSYKHKGSRETWKTSRNMLQIDLAPTLSLLMGLPIPSNNLGQALTQPLSRLSDLEKLANLYINAQQIISLMEQNVPDFEHDSSFDLYKYAVKQQETCLSAPVCKPEQAALVFRNYESAMEAMSSKIATSLTTYDMYSLLISIALLSMCLLAILFSSFINLESLWWCLPPIGCCTLSVILIFCHMITCTSQSANSALMCGWGLKSVAAQIYVFVSFNVLSAALWTTVTNIYKYWPKAFKAHVRLDLTSCLWVGTVLHSLSFGSSSFVEEEHQSWYHLTMTLYLGLILRQFYSHLRAVVSKRTVGANDQSIYIQKKFDEVFEKADDVNTRLSGDCHSEKAAKLINKTKEDEYYEQLKTEKAEGVPNTMEMQVGRAREPHTLWLPLKYWLPWKQCVALVTVMLLGRFMRTLNQTGNKWLDIPDLGDFLIRPENKSILSAVVLLSLMVVIAVAYTDNGRLEWTCFLAGVGGCYQYRVATQAVNPVLHLSGREDELSQGIAEARFVYMMMLLMNLIHFMKYLHNRNQQIALNKNEIIHSNVCNIRDKNGTITHDQKPVLETKMQKNGLHFSCSFIKTFQLSWILLMTLLLRTHNTLLVSMATVQEWLLWKYVIYGSDMKSSSLALLVWWIGQAGFFQQGNSNSISTVDVSAGYVGLTDYQPVLVALLLSCSTYAIPVFWVLSMIKYILCQHMSRNTENVTMSINSKVKTSLLDCVQTLATERLLTLMLYCVIVTSQRYHLFVWTVFSPKLLYEGMLTVMFAIFVIVISIISSCIKG